MFLLHNYQIFSITLSFEKNYLIFDIEINIKLCDIHLICIRNSTQNAIINCTITFILIS